MKWMEPKNRIWQGIQLCPLCWITMSLCEHKKLHSSSNPGPLFCCRCLPGALLHSSPPHWHPLVLPGAGSGSEDQTWQHWGVELRLPTAGRHRGIQSDGACPAPIRKSHYRYSTLQDGINRFTGSLLGCGALNVDMWTDNDLVAQHTHRTTAMLSHFHRDIMQHTQVSLAYLHHF